MFGRAPQSGNWRRPAEARLRRSRGASRSRRPARMHRLWRWLALAIACYGVVAFCAAVLVGKPVWPWTRHGVTALAGLAAIFAAVMLAGTLGGLQGGHGGSTPDEADPDDMSSSPDGDAPAKPAGADDAKDTEG